MPKPKNKSSQKSTNGKWGTLHIRIPNRLIAELRVLADRDGRSISAFTSRFIQQNVGQLIEAQSNAGIPGTKTLHIPKGAL